MSNKKIIDNERFDIYVDQLYLALRDKFKLNPDVIVGISRGGLIPAVLLAHKFKVEKVYSWGITTRGNGEEQKETIIYQELSDLISYIDEQINTTKILFVDDIYDSGRTLKELKKVMKEWTNYGLNFDWQFVTVVKKQKSSKQLLYSRLQVPQDTWVDFYYEK